MSGDALRKAAALFERMITEHFCNDKGRLVMICEPETYKRLQSKLDALRSALAAPAPSKLWLWRNHVDGRPEYLAFDNPFPVFMDSDDPQTLGEPCGYALVKASRPGRTDWTEDAVLADSKRSTPPPEPSREVTQEQIEAWDNEAIELARDEILANPVCAPFHALHQRHFAALAHAAGFEAGRKAGGRDGERLRAIIEHGWIVVRDLEGEWQIKAPRRYGAPVLIAESMSLFHAIDLADAAIDRAMTEEPKS